MSGRSSPAATAASILVLAAVACAPAAVAPAGVSPTQSPSVETSAGPASNAPTPPAPETGDAGIPAARLENRQQVSAVGRNASRVRITAGGDYYWIAVDRGAPGGWQGFVVEWRPPAEPRELIRAGRPGALLQQLTVSDDWIAWIEHRDQVRGGDSRVYVMARGGSQPTLVDDIARYGPVATFPELTLDGSDLYWTVPALVDGVWRGKLLRKRLLSGPSEVVESADKQLFTWPTAYQGSIAYEVVGQDSSLYGVRYRTADGAARDVEATPASEPSVGPGYLVFKRANRYDSGDLALLDLQSGSIRGLGSGEKPITAGEMISWYDLRAGEGILARARDGCRARYTANRASGEAGEQQGVLVGARLAWPFVANRDGVISEYIRTATLVSLPC